jgi:hypothetical protein
MLMIRKIIVCVLLLIGSRSFGAETFDVICGRAMKTLRKGGTVSQEVKDECQAAWQAYTARFADVEYNTQLPEPTRTEYYLRTVTMAMIDRKHGGWPIRSTLRSTVLPELKRQIDNGGDAYTRFCVIFPALAKKEVAYAAASYEEVRKADPFLADLVLLWSIPYRPEWLTDHYAESGDGRKAEDVAARVKQLCFPKGMDRVGLEDFSRKPKRGYMFMSNSKKAAENEIYKGHIVVALSGIRVGNGYQYNYLRALDLDNPQMALIIWDGEKYRSVTVELKHRLFGVQMGNYIMEPGSDKP